MSQAWVWSMQWGRYWWNWKECFWQLTERPVDILYFKRSSILEVTACTSQISKEGKVLSGSWQTTSWEYSDNDICKLRKCKRLNYGGRVCLYGHHLCSRRRHLQWLRRERTLTSWSGNEAMYGTDATTLPPRSWSKEIIVATITITNTNFGRRNWNYV